VPPDFEGTSVLYRKVAALAAGLSASVLVLGSGVASADERTYVQLLDAGNVPYDNPTGAVAMGRAVCSSLGSGGSVEHLEHPERRAVFGNHSEIT
jgi:hypothetical protein